MCSAHDSIECCLVCTAPCSYKWHPRLMMSSTWKIPLTKSSLHREELEMDRASALLLTGPNTSLVMLVLKGQKRNGCELRPSSPSHFHGGCVPHLRRTDCILERFDSIPVRISTLISTSDGSCTLRCMRV